MIDRDVDVLIAGGSIAGIATAFALREFGYSVLVVEPGQRVDRRLAGELIHPLGVAGLEELGLLDPEAFAEASPIEGFAVFPDHGDEGSPITLRYGHNNGSPVRALALDHAALRRNLEAKARECRDVEFLDGFRVTAVDLSDPQTPKVTVQRGSEARELSCRMLVAADGASSTVRSLAGIGHTRRGISTISGYVIDDATLPAPGFGHVMIGGRSLVLAYAIGNGRARVMFDQPVEQDDVPAAQHRDALIAAMPAAFRDQIAAAVQAKKPLSFKSAEVVAHAASRGAVVLVGDAGGSCHPLTATGMTFGISDALRLRDALRLHRTDLPAAFAHYDRVRRRAQRSRRMVASALHDLCSRGEPEMRVIRAGLIRYWRQDVEGQTRTMAILAMTDDRITSAFWQFFKVARHGLAEFWQDGRKARLARVGLGAKLVAAVGAMTIKHMSATLKAR